MNAFGVTPRQKDVLDFIVAHCEAHGTSPTFKEIADGTGLKSRSGIARMLDALVYRGYIRRLPHRARTIELIDEKSMLRLIHPDLASRVNVRANRLGIAAASVIQEALMIGLDIMESEPDPAS